MPMDENLAELFKVNAAGAFQVAAQTGATINQNAANGLTTVQTLVIQAQASNSDDPAVIAALNTASRSPEGQKQA